MLARWGSWSLGIALLVGGMALSIGAPGEAKVTNRLADVGLHTSATVTEEALSRQGAGNTIVRLTIEFQDEFGLTTEGTEIYCGEPEDKAVGDAVGVVYDPDDPEVFRFDECKHLSESGPLLIGGVVALTLGAAVILLAWRRTGWRLGFWGIPIALIGVVFIGASIDDSCECEEGLYFGIALAVIGTVGCAGRAFRGPGERLSNDPLP